MSQIQSLGGTSTNSGTPIQRLETTSTALITTTAIIPFDSTIPQITEGTHLVTRTITPTNAVNLLIIDFYSIMVSPSSVGSVALFKDTGVNAIFATAFDFALGISWNPIFFRYTLLAGSTSLQTFSIRFGSNDGGTVEMNTTRLGVGTSTLNLSITEVLP